MKKVLSPIITLVMIITAMVFFTMEASAGRYTTISTVFEEDYDGEIVTANTSGAGEIITDAGSGNKYIKISKGWSEEQFSYALPAITSGKIMVQFDYMKDSENVDLQSYVALADNNKYSTKEYLRLLSTNNYGTKQNKMTAFKAEMIGSASITQAGKWYTFVEIIDMDTHEVTATVYEKGSVAPLGTLHFDELERTGDGCSGWSETKNEFARFIYYGDADSCMDNISIKYIYEDPNLIFNEDYEGAEITPQSNGVGTVMTEANGNKYMKMDMTIDGVTDWAKTMFAYDFPAVSSGIVNVQFDYMKEDKVPQTYMALSGYNGWKTDEMLRLMGVSYNYGVFTAFENVAMLNNSGKNGTLQPGKWYTQKVTLNLETHEVTATVYERGTENVVAYLHYTNLPDIVAGTGNGYKGWPATSESFVRIVHFGDTDACIDNIKITRTENTPKEYAYSFAVVGDTQTLTSKYPDTLAVLYDWIKNNAESKKMKWVFGLGDITDNDTDDEWTFAKSQIAKLDGVVPYSLVRGNHDSKEKFKATFPYADYSAKISGSMSGDMLNTYQKFTVGDTKYMVVNLDWGVTDEVVAWANDVIADNPDHNVIIVTHGYLNSDGTTLDSGDEAAPTDYSSLHNNGDELWDMLIKRHANITLVLSGHISTENIVVTKTKGDNGNTVTQMLVDPQTTDQNNVGSGLGLVAMLYFSEDGKAVDVEYYSTLKKGKYLSNNQFSMEIDAVEVPDGEFKDIASISGVSFTVNLNGDTSEGKVYAALYSADGKLSAVKEYAPAKSVKVEFDEGDAGAFVKVMWWSGNMTPECLARTTVSVN